MDTWAPLELNKNKNKNNITNQSSSYYWDGERQKVSVGNFFFVFKYSLFDSRSSDRRISSGQTRKVLYAMRATREYQKNEISPKIQVNIRKILVFSFSQIYGILLVP